MPSYISYRGLVMNKRAFAISEAVGCFVIYAAAVYLHFAYTLSGGSALGLLFGAVNESVWEHVKIFSAAYAGWAILQLCWIRVPFRKYAVAKCIGLYSLMIGITAFYYAYTAITGTNIPAVDIISSAVAVIAAQLISYLGTTGDNRLEELFHPALMMIMLYYLMFFSFTVFPPRAELFRDPVTGGYGINGM